MWPILVVILVALVFCLDYYINRTESGKLFSKIPGPRGIPVFGNIFSFLLDPVVLFAYSRTLANRYKRSYGIKLCGRRILNIFDPREIEIILSSHKHITKSILYDFLDPWLKEGLLTSKGSKWQKRRKILTPAFHFNILRQFCNIFSEQSGKIVQELRKEIYQPDTDIISYVTQFTINSICETAMGIQLDSSDGNTSKYFSKYKEAIRDMGKFLVYRLVRLWMHVTPFYNMSAVGRKQAEVLPDLHKFTLDVIRRRREATSVKGTSAIVGEIEDEDYMRSSKRRLAMLDLLLAAEADGKIDEPGIREEVDTFMFEGHDTTTMGITFCLMLLANHQFAQERIVEEMNEIFKDRNQIATMEDLNNMRYLELCLKESLRIYPSVPFISRALLEDVHMPNYTIPANTTCHIHIIDLHRDARIYPDPDKFIPERFLPENCAKRHPFAYIPFSAGPRNCIGQRFAMYELKSVVSTVLRNFILEPVTTPDDIIFSSDLVLRARDPIKIKFLPRYS